MNTQNFEDFGYRELAEAGKLLTAYKASETDNTRFLANNVKTEFNPNSGAVFLIDEDMNVAMMNGDILEDFFTCPECRHEGFLDEMEHNTDNDECQEYLKNIRNGGGGE